MNDLKKSLNLSNVENNNEPCDNDNDVKPGDIETDTQQ